MPSAALPHSASPGRVRGKYLLPSLGALGIILGICFYGSFRTLMESVGFDLAVTARSLAVALILPVIFGLFPLLITAELIRPDKTRPYLRYTIVFVVFLLAGSLVSEIWILKDESDFRREVSRDASAPYSRPRAWPNTSAALVYLPESGIHATD